MPDDLAEPGQAETTNGDQKTMMKYLMLTVLAGGVCCGGTAWAGGLDPKTVQADSKFVMHLDGEKLWASDFGKKLKAEIVASPGKTKIDAMNLILGINLLEDIKGLTIYAYDLESAKDHAVIVCQGKFDQERIVTLLRAGDGYSSAAQGQFTVHHWIDKDAGSDPARNQRWGTFARSDLIMVSSNESVLKNALDVMDGKKASMAAGAKLGGYDLAKEKGILIAAAASTSKALQQNADAAMFQNIEGFCVALKEETPTDKTAADQTAKIKLGVRMKANSPEAAQQLEQILKGFQAMGMLQAQKKPELAAVAQALQIASDPATSEVKGEFSYGTEALFKMVKQLQAAKAAVTPVPPEDVGPAATQPNPDAAPAKDAPAAPKAQP